MRAPGRYGTYPGRARGGAVLQWAAASHSLGQRRAWLGQWTAAGGGGPKGGPGEEAFQRNRRGRGARSGARRSSRPGAQRWKRFSWVPRHLAACGANSSWVPGSLHLVNLVGSRGGGLPNLLVSRHLRDCHDAACTPLINPRGLLLPMVLARRWLKKAKPSLHQTANPTELLFVRHRSTSIREETSFTQQGHPPIIYNPMLSHVNPHDRQSYHRSGHTLRPMLRASGFLVVQSQKGYPSHQDGWM